MRITLSNDSAENLRKYAGGALSATDLARWLAHASYDLDVAESERDLLASIDLIATEVVEQLRAEDELRAAR